MAEWNTLSAKFPEDELDEIERIKKQSGRSYNEIIRSGVKFYIGLTLAKEMLAEISSDNKIKIKNKDLGEILNSPNYQGNLEQKISKLVKILVVELIEKGLDFKERTATIRKKRKVGRPKRERKVGRPKDTGIDF